MLFHPLKLKKNHKIFYKTLIISIFNISIHIAIVFLKK